MSVPGENLAQRLERGELMFYPRCPFGLPSEIERLFLESQDLGGAAHKNISYDPLTGRLHGFAHRTSEQTAQLRVILAKFSHAVVSWLRAQLPRYAPQWELDRVSFRPLEEATRNLRLHARNDLLHIDAFPTRPTNGWRILRVFANLNRTDSRVWVTSDPFARLLEQYGQAAGLPTRGFTLARAVDFFRQVPHLFRPGKRSHSEYDLFMLRFHNFLKTHEEFQERSVKRLWSFPPLSGWMAMTDALSHAVLRGRYALEHSFFISPASLALPDESPPALLARICGFPVLPQKSQAA
jgi:hypothetical protein